MKTIAIIQARVSSSRLPGKVLKNLLGQPMLMRQIERVQRTMWIDHILVATSVEPSDDLLVQVLEKYGVPVFRGNLDDVLDRYYQAAKRYKPEHVVRLTGDCPLADPAIIDSIMQQHLDKGVDYTSNTLHPSYPDGLDVEVMRFSALEKTWHDSELPSEREHVTPYIRNHPERFTQHSVSHEKDLSGLRWTVDEPEDFELVSQIYEALYKTNPAFNIQDILKLFQNCPELNTVNDHYRRNEGLKKSNEADKAFLKEK